jgi:curved DNA-binding protein CbpA
MYHGTFEDYYEMLQISPNADPETIHRVYRILAQRYHPDNADTCHPELFHNLTVAYRILSDPEQRAAYDVEHRASCRKVWKIFDQSNSSQGVDGEKRKRQGILGLLYKKRLADPEQPHITLREFENLLGVPKEHLQFALWYLLQGEFVQRTDNGRHVITLKGVDLAEQMIAARPELTPLALPAASGIAA